MRAHEKELEGQSVEEREAGRKRLDELWQREHAEQAPRSDDERLAILAEVLDKLPPEE